MYNLNIMIYDNNCHLKYCLNVKIINFIYLQNLKNIITYINKTNICYVFHNIIAL